MGGLEKRTQGIFFYPGYFLKRGKKDKICSIIHCNCKRLQTLWPNELYLGQKKICSARESEAAQSMSRLVSVARCGCLTGAVSAIGKSISLCFFLVPQVSLYDTCEETLPFFCHQVGGKLGRVQSERRHRYWRRQGEQSETRGCRFLQHSIRGMPRPPSFQLYHQYCQLLVLLLLSTILGVNKAYLVPSVVRQLFQHYDEIFKSIHDLS